MWNSILQMFSYPFMVNACIVGVMVSICAAILGVSLVLKRYSMIGDGLSHVGFGALALAAALNIAPLSLAIPIVFITALILLRISESGKLKGDAAVALISTSALAIGVMIVSVTKGMNTDLNNYMFGSILAMSRQDVIFSIVLTVCVLCLYFIFYHKIFAVTFDENFAKATGLKVEIYRMAFAFLTAVVVVLGMRMMGALLISSLVIFPALTSMRICRTFKSVILCSIVLAVIGFMSGLMLSYVLGTPTGASIVVIDMILYLIFAVSGKIRRI